MSTVKQCDICRAQSRSWIPQGWREVKMANTLVAFALQDDTVQDVCEECWDFLVHERGGDE